MRSNAGVIAVTVVALFLGVLAVTQIQAQDVYSRSLQLETPASLTTLIANLSERNNAIKDEILDLRHRTDTAREAIASGTGSLTEAERQLSQLRVFAGMSAVSGPGISVRIEGTFDERALSDLVNELRNAGAEAIAVNTARVGPRSWFGRQRRGPRSVAGSCGRRDRCDVCRDDSDRRDHRSVPAHLQKHSVRREPGVDARPAGARDTASITREAKLARMTETRTAPAKAKGPLPLYLDDVVILRKPHPCGGNTWRIVRLGADIGLRCTTCEHRVLVARSSIERDIKRFVSRGPQAPTD